MALPEQVGRYTIFDRIASGGMASVHVGRLLAQGGFSRTVAIKRLHPQFAEDPEFVVAFLDEARLAARIRHPNVVPTLDVVANDGELFLVMEYVEGEPLSALVRAALGGGVRLMPLEIASSILTETLHGLHAAHEATSDHGEPLGIVHRDLSPQNILVGVDGAARVLDFGIAKAISQSHSTRDGILKGKIAYMSPEQIIGQPLTRRSDLFSAAVVLWEVLTGARLFKAESDAASLHMIREMPITRPSLLVPGLPPALDAVVLKGLERDPALRFATAEEMAEALEQAATPATARRVGTWVRTLSGERLQRRAQRVVEIESSSTERPVLPSPSSARAVSDPPRIEAEEARSLSQQSSISVETPKSRSVVPPPRKGLLVAALGLLAGGAIGVAALRSPGAGHSSSAAPALDEHQAAAAPQADPPMAVAVPSDVPAAPPTPPAARAPQPPATATSDPKPPATATKPLPTAAVPRPERAKTPRPAASNSGPSLFSRD